MVKVLHVLFSQNKEKELILWTTALQSLQYSCADFKAKKVLKMIYSVLLCDTGQKNLHPIILALEFGECGSSVLLLFASAL